MRHAWLLLCLLPDIAWANAWLRTEGVATTPAGETVYREVHWQREAKEGGERWVLYQCPDGRPFARKYLPGTARPQVRGYSLEDRRSGQRAVVQAEADTVRVDWKEDAAAPSRRRALGLAPDAVVDAGFDAAVRLHWPALMRGERVSLPFLAAGRQRFYPIQLRHSGAVRWQGLDAQAIAVTLDAWYGGLAPRLSLVYSDADRRLLEFRGISNLRDAGGTYPQVVVRFPTAPTPRSAGEWQQAWAQPLVDGCSRASG